MKSIFAVACCAAVMAGTAAFEAVADGAAPVVATPVIQIPKSNCTKPDKLPRVEPTRSQQKLFDEQLKAYTACVTGYVEQLKKLSKTYADASNTATDTANDTIKEFNDFAKTVNPDDDDQGKDKDKD